MKLTFLESLEYALFVFIMAVTVLFTLSLLFKLFSFVMDKIIKTDFKKNLTGFFKKKNDAPISQSELEGPVFATVTDEEGNQKHYKLASIKELKENDQ
ncbi:MAG TPA: hypothetical protein VIL24_00630 [Clostridia bacterium]